MSVLKIRSVKCRKPSSGIDNSTRAVFATIGAATAAGVAIAGATATGGATLAAVGMAAGGGAGTGVTVINTLATFFHGSDDFYMNVNDKRFWPAEGDHDMDSQDKADINKSVRFTKKVRIDLKEYDWGSSDDSLGYLEFDITNMESAFIDDRFIVANEDEGSIYEIDLRIEK